MGYFFFRKESKDKFRETLFTEYKNIAQELSGVLKDVLYLSLIPESFPIEKCKEIDRALSDFAFRHLLVLPQEVLQEINCLHVCLVCGGHNSYMIKAEDDIPILKPRNTEEEIKELLENVAFVTTQRTLFDIYKKYKKLPNSVYLKCQARHLMMVVNKCWNMSLFYEWDKYLPKKTIGMRNE